MGNTGILKMVMPVISKIYSLEHQMAKNVNNCVGFTMSMIPIDESTSACCTDFCKQIKCVLSGKNIEVCWNKMRQECYANQKRCQP